MSVKVQGPAITGTRERGREVKCYEKNQRHSYETHLVPIRESCPKFKSIIMSRKEVDLDVNPILVPSAVFFIRFSLEYFHSNLS